MRAAQTGSGLFTREALAGIIGSAPKVYEYFC